MKNSKFTTIIFDLDGTLLDTLLDIHNAVNITMTKFGFPTRSVDEVRSFINNGAYSLIQRAMPGEYYDNDEKIKQVLKDYMEIYLANVRIDTKPYEGVTELIERLKKEGYHLALVSNKPDDSAKDLTRHFFSDSFEYISGTGTGLPTKPDRECIDNALKSMGVTRDNLLYVGDSVVDVKTAHNSGVPCAGVTWGFHGRNGFADQVPDCFVANTDELYSVIATGNI